MRRLLADDATVELGSARILGERGGAVLVLLDELSASATRRPNGAVYTWGRGRAGSVAEAAGAGGTGGEPGGRLSWTAEIDTDGRQASATAGLDRVPLATFLPLLPELPWHRPEHTLLTGRLEIGRFELETGDDGEALPIRIQLEVRDLSLASEMIAERPVVASASITGEGRWWPSRQRLDVSRSSVEMGEARLQLAARLAPRRMQIRAELPSTPCGAALSAVPDSVLGLVSEFELDGLLTAGVDLDLDLDSPARTELDLQVDDRCRFTAAPHDARIARFEGRFVHPIRLADGSLGELVTGPGTEAWTRIEEVSPALVWAVLAHEDAAFFRHSGFAPWAIETALQRNLEEERFAYGASTVSMQLAKNLFLVRDKTLARKLREVVLTWWLEKNLDKRQILELYLNVIEYGPGLYGIRQAAEHYFGHRPDELTLAESLFLANLLPAPRSHHREYQTGEVRPGTRSAMNVLMAAMARRGWIDRPTLFRGLAEVQTLRFHHGEGLRPAPSQSPEIVTAPLPWGRPAQLIVRR